MYIYNLSNKKVCVYNKKTCVYLYMGVCLDKYISVATWLPQTKIPSSAVVDLVALKVLDH